MSYVPHADLYVQAIKKFLIAVHDCKTLCLLSTPVIKYNQKVPCQ